MRSRALTRSLKKRAQQRRGNPELKEILLTNTSRLRAYAEGEHPPPEHPASSRFGPESFFGSCSLKDAPEDLSE